MNKNTDGSIESFVRARIAAGDSPNQLIREKSPYLLQHAFNPVAWFPWGNEAFAKARRENKPVFLSIGYSTCHWCHVMAHESFENAEIAALINEHFVPVKVDREERPDVDRVYMTATQALSGHGGWPMTVFLTPELKPFFAGTYFPPLSAHGRPGFKDLLHAVQRAWTLKPGEILDSAGRIGEFLAAQGSADFGGALPEAAALERAAASFAQDYDARHGGFGPAPKFPRPSVLSFLLREQARTGDAQALAMVLGTLRAMAAGGLRDHLGGGFHRYSVDAQWRVSHFEKMLYDQAQLAIAYVEAFQVTGDEDLAAVARETLDYVCRDMTGEGGGFHSAEDADSPLPEDPSRHAEGAFYLWTAAEIRQLLGDEAEMFCYAYGVVDSGNALADPHGEFGNRNVLYLAHPAAETARRFDLGSDETAARLARARGTLRQARGRRPRPHRDDKVISSWNGLTISALARAAQAFDAPEYLAAAHRAADFVQERLFDAPLGELRRRFRDGEAGMPGQLDDYAFVVQGLLDLYEAGFEIDRLRTALLLTTRQIELFWDEARGGFFDTAAGDITRVAHMKDGSDSAEPAGNSVAALNLLRLAQMLGRADLREKAHRTIAAFARVLEQTTAMPQMLVALDLARASPRQIVIAGGRDSPEAAALLREVHRRFLPHRVLLRADGGAGEDWLSGQLPFVRDLRARGGPATAYVCRDFTCREPATDPRVLAQQLSDV